MSRSKPDSFLDAFCLYRVQIALLFAICLGLFGLAGLSILYLTPGTASYVVSVVNFVTLGVVLVPMSVILWHCRDVE